MKRALHAWWHATAKAFNLTSLLHGKTARFKTESRLTISTWRVADFFGQLVFGKYDTTESDARVPSSDQVVLLPPAERKGNGVFVMLDKLGAPKTADDKLRLLKQDRAAREGGRDPRADYRIVWLPRFWRTRVHALIFAALGTASAVIALAFFVPLVVGRLASSLFIEEEVHDGYSWVSGDASCYNFQPCYHIASLSLLCRCLLYPIPSIIQFHRLITKIPLGNRTWGGEADAL